MTFNILIIMVVLSLEMSKFLGSHVRQFMPSQLALRALNGSEKTLLCLRIPVQVQLITWSASFQ